MGLRQRLFSRPASNGGQADEPGSGPSAVPGYERMGDKEVVARLSGLTQAELAEVEGYERAHKARPAVFAKLRYLREDEPIPGYDKLGAKEITDALSGADAATVRRVRAYERKFQGRQEVAAEVERVLPGSQAGAEETQAKADKAELTRKGIRDRPS